MAFNRNGYGQVEPNQLSAQKTGQIYASLPLDTEVKVLQNGEFMFYDYADNKVTASPSAKDKVGEPLLVFNEIKLYEPFWRTTYKDFAMIRVGDNYVTSKLATEGYGDGALTVGAQYGTATDYESDPVTIQEHSDWQAGYRMDGIAPRMFKTNVGDIMTTNMVDKAGTYAQGTVLALAKDDTAKTLVLTSTVSDDISTMRWVVAKVYTMPDGQPGLKLQRIL